MVHCVQAQYILSVPFCIKAIERIIKYLHHIIWVLFYTTNILTKFRQSHCWRGVGTNYSRFATNISLVAILKSRMVEVEALDTPRPRTGFKRWRRLFVRLSVCRHSQPATCFTATRTKQQCLEESPCTWEFSRTNLQVCVLVLGPLVFVLERRSPRKFSRISSRIAFVC